MSARRRDVLLLVVDSLRAASLGGHGPGRPTTPFLDRLGEQALWFRRAYASECWTLPSHLSMFTGRLPSEHGAHFQTMAYRNPSPTIAERLAAVGYRTALVTRNFVFDGAIPGVTRGFQIRERPIASSSRADLAAMFLALAKPRVRRHIQRTGFFHPRHAAGRDFVRAFARTLMPADDLALARVLDLITAQRRAGQRVFICCNLYDVHAPYAPQPHSLLRPWRSPAAVWENLSVPFHLAALGQHAYLREGAQVRPRTGVVLRGRYHRAIELMDRKLAAFFAAAGRLLDDTVVILTSDHGEAFGEHGLYLHDASVYDTHLHVPLWIRHPDRGAASIDDIVSTRDLFGVLLASAGERRWSDTLLDAGHRAAHPFAVAEHFHYPRLAGMAERYRQNLLAVITADDKLVVRGEGPLRFDRSRDRDEQHPQPISFDECTARIGRAAGSAAATDAVLADVRAWCGRFASRSIALQPAA
ncbi:sulfatase [bacterium]|nr:sulfatase [bacterium]